jgi:probable phosphoglycerate mutase
MSDAGRTAVKNDLRQLAASHPTMIYHPPDEAATETARLCAAAFKSRTKAVHELSDPNLGLLEGLTAQEFAERYPTRHKQWEDDPVTVSPPEGEDVIHAADRIFSAIAKIIKRSRSEEVAIVLHEMGIAMLRCWLADRPLHELRAIKNRPRIERFAFPVGLVRTLESAASEAHVQS